MALRTAAGVLALQGAAVLAFGGWLGYESVVATATDNGIARSSTAYFVLLGGAVVAVAVALHRRNGWAAGAGTVIELICVPVAWSMVRGGTYVPGALLAASAVLALVCLFTPSTRTALGR